MTASMCVPAGFSYLTGLGIGIIAIVLSPWLTQLQRAVYRDGPAFQRGIANAMPMWGPGAFGALMLLVCGGWIAGWVKTCIPIDEWNVVGLVLVGIALTMMLVAGLRLVRGRLLLGTREQGGERSGSGQPPSDASMTAVERPRTLPPDRRRVIVEFVLTYEAAVIVLLVGIG